MDDSQLWPVVITPSTSGEDRLRGATSRQQLVEVIASMLFVRPPVDASTQSPISIGAGVPGPDSSAEVWFKTSMPVFLAIKTNGQWVAVGTGHGVILPYDADNPEQARAEYLVPLTTPEANALGLAPGKWGKKTLPTIEGVSYA